MEWVAEDLPRVEGGDEPLVSHEILCCIALELVATAMDIGQNFLLLPHDFWGSNSATALFRAQNALHLSTTQI